jgi:hypothetical protein
MRVQIRFSVVYAVLLFSCEAHGKAVLSFDEDDAARESAAELTPAMQGDLNLAGSPADEPVREHPTEIHAELSRAAADGGGPSASAGTLSVDAVQASAGGSPSAGGPSVLSTAGSAGSTRVAPPTKRLSWQCTQVARSCECVQSSSKADSCSIPRPTCCYTLPNGANPKCLCVPNGSSECERLDANPAAERVTACPR